MKPAEHTLNADTRALLDLLANAGGPSLEEMLPADARAFFAAGRDFFARDQEQVSSVEDICVEHQGRSLEMRIYRPVGTAPEMMPGLVYFHGGGWVLGDLDSQDPLCRKLCNASGVVILSVQYGHAPEAPYPAAVDDASAAFDYICTNATQLGLDERRIAVGGESAGGTLAAVVAQTEGRLGATRIRCQLLLYPVTDLSRADGQRQPSDGYFVTAKMLRWMIDLYLAGADPADPRVSPLLEQDLTGLPPAIMVLCGFDPLLSEGMEYRDRLADAGVTVTTKLYPGQIHAFLTMDRHILEAHDAILEIGGLLRQSLSL
ncbi:alpha/beta hydrolase [Sphingosinicella xenopeptidilytica]|uniref:Alpha/beta hydrolase n=1 Tax=Sphingosinicella xenopeptidilytica TaxID=364098 RepID=A0ABW3C5H7_SPHXN